MYPKNQNGLLIWNWESNWTMNLNGESINLIWTLNLSRRFTGWPSSFFFFALEFLKWPKEWFEHNIKKEWFEHCAKVENKLLITYTTKICYQQGFPVQNYIGVRLNSIGVEKWDCAKKKRQRGRRELERLKRQKWSRST